MKTGLWGKILSFFKIMGIVGVFWIAVLLLLESKTVGAGIRNGITLCTNIMIPSLFPFLVFSGFLTLSPISQWIARPFGWITRHLFGLPEEMGTVFLLSCIGGYPVGARAIVSLLEQKRLDSPTASRMLCFCVNAGPSFLISAVGVSLYGNGQIGLVLLISQLSSALLIGWVLSWMKTPFSLPIKKEYPSTASAFVQAVTSSAIGMLYICAFVVLFSGLLSALETTGILPAFCQLLSHRLPWSVDASFYSALCSGLLEVTSGCIAAAQLDGKTAFLLTAFLVSFGGFSVICQIAACFNNVSLSLVPFVLSRFANGFLTAAIAYPLYEKFCKTISVSISSYPPLMVVSTQSVVIALCMIAMCSIVLLSISVKRLSIRKS